MGQTAAKPHIEVFHPKKYLTRVELVSIKSVFNSLKTGFSDDFQCIEEKQFLSRLGLPNGIEAGSLLYKAFSYLGSYPDCKAKGPVPLTLNSFLTAFVVLIGRLDQPKHEVSHSLFFQSLSILPESKEVADSPKSSIELDFDKLDFDKTIDDGPEILCRDLTELIVLLLWICGNEDMTENKKIAKDSIGQLEKTKEGTCVSYRVLSDWQARFSPHFFKPIQAFLIQTFAYIEIQSRIPQEDVVPKFDRSDILSFMHCTLLLWALPEHMMSIKTWTRLYSAQQNGYSMNRFESHVFKYPGPTLIVMNIEAREPKRYTSSREEESQRMLIGAYIPQAWKNSKHFWGTNECILFELEPMWNVYRTTKKNERYIHYHHDTGIGFGARDENTSDFIISLQNTLQKGVYENEVYPRCPTFTSSKKDFKYLFETENIEVFGLGTERDKERQLKEWEFEKREAGKRSGLNIRQSDGKFDKELLRMAGIIDNDQRQER